MKENKGASGKAARDGGKPAFPYPVPRTRVSSRVLLSRVTFRDSHAIRTFDCSGVNLHPRPSTCLQAMRYLAMKDELFDRFADLRRRWSAVLQNKKWHKR